MTSDEQKDIDLFVNREVIMLASQLVEDLLEASMYGQKTFGGIELDNIENLYITEEEAAQEYGYKSLEEMQEAGADRQEIYEWWFVTPWFYERLREVGEPVLNSNYGYLWGRTCTGQAISLDAIIQTIYDNLMKEWQQE